MNTIKKTMTVLLILTIIILFGCEKTKTTPEPTANKNQTNISNESVLETVEIEEIKLFLECQNITSASYSGELSRTQAFNLVPHNYEFGMVAFGQYAEGTWKIDSKFKSPKSVAILPIDNLIVDKEYEGGILTIICDEKEINITIPEFIDITKEGFMLNTIEFNRMYVSPEGLVYSDPYMIEILE